MAQKAHCYFQEKNLIKRQAWKSLAVFYKKCSELSIINTHRLARRFTLTKKSKCVDMFSANISPKFFKNKTR